jgi:hypothetical protein
MLRPLIGLAGCRTLTVNSPSSRRGVHLLRLIEDQGNKLIVASKNPFEVI